MHNVSRRALGYIACAFTVFVISPFMMTGEALAVKTFILLLATGVFEAMVFLCRKGLGWSVLGYVPPAIALALFAGVGNMAPGVKEELGQLYFTLLISFLNAFLAFTVAAIIGVLVTRPYFLLAGTTDARGRSRRIPHR